MTKDTTEEASAKKDAAKRQKEVEAEAKKDATKKEAEAAAKIEKKRLAAEKVRAEAESGKKSGVLARVVSFFSISKFKSDQTEVRAETKNAAALDASSATRTRQPSSATTELRSDYESYPAVRGLTHTYPETRAYVKELLRDGAISQHKGFSDEVNKYADRYPTHDHYLRSRATGCDKTFDIDHTFECQLIADCFLRTTALHPMLVNIDYKKSRTQQLEGRNARLFVGSSFIDTVYDIQNGTKRFEVLVADSRERTFNLTLMDPQLNRYKGHAVTTFINGQYSRSGERGGKVDFAKYYKLEEPFNEFAFDAAGKLAKETENLLYKVTEKYIKHLENSSRGGAEQKDHDKRINGLIESITQLVIVKMLDR